MYQLTWRLNGVKIDFLRTDVLHVVPTESIE